jgi:hypothetical protein
MTAISTSEIRKQSSVGKIGWGILLVISVLLVYYGLYWFGSGPEIMLANVAERTSLTLDDFREGSPSAYDVIALVSRQFAIGNAALGLLTLILAWNGFRHGTRLAWWAMWVLVATNIANAVTLVLAGGVNVVALTFLGLGGVTLVGQLLARRGVVS